MIALDLVAVVAVLAFASLCLTLSPGLQGSALRRGFTFAGLAGLVHVVANILQVVGDFGLVASDVPRCVLGNPSSVFCDAGRSSAKLLPRLVPRTQERRQSKFWCRRTATSNATLDPGQGRQVSAESSRTRKREKKGMVSNRPGWTSHGEVIWTGQRKSANAFLVTVTVPALWAARTAACEVRSIGVASWLNVTRKTFQWPP